MFLQMTESEDIVRYKHLKKNKQAIKSLKRVNKNKMYIDVIFHYSCLTLSLSLGAGGPSRSSLHFGGIFSKLCSLWFKDKLIKILRSKFKVSVHICEQWSKLRSKPLTVAWSVDLWHSGGQRSRSCFEAVLLEWKGFYAASSFPTTLSSSTNILLIAIYHYNSIFFTPCPKTPNETRRPPVPIKISPGLNGLANCKQSALFILTGVIFST